MFVAYLVVTGVTIVLNAGIAVADLARARFVLANSATVGVPRSWLWWLGLVKGAGAVGLLLGLLGVRVLGIAAGIGLVLFFVGAIIAHVRARALSTMGGPGLFLVCAAGSLILALVMT